MTLIINTILIVVLVNLMITIYIKISHKLLTFGGDKLIISVLGNEIYFTPAIHYSYYSHTLYIQFLMLDITVDRYLI